MAVITATIQPGERRNEVTEIQKALISLNTSIEGGEMFTPMAAGTYGPNTQAAMTVLLQRFGFQPPVPLHFDAAVGTLLNIPVAGPAGITVGAKELDLSEIQDVVLSMEYDITPGGP